MVNININLTAKDFESEEIVDRLLYLIRELENDPRNYDEENVEFSSEHKIMNSEKEIRILKKKYEDTFERHTESISTQLGRAIFRRRVFTIDELRDEFPNVNWGTLRAYVHSLKKDGLLVSLDRGKYALI